MKHLELFLLIGILIGSTLAGIGGALLAVPVAAAVQVLINNVLSYGTENSDPREAAAAANNTAKALNLAAKAEQQKQNSDATKP